MSCDHRKLKAAFPKASTHTMSDSWLNFVTRYTLDNCRLPGEKNVVADYLSRSVNAVRVPSRKNGLCIDQSVHKMHQLCKSEVAVLCHEIQKAIIAGTDVKSS